MTFIQILNTNLNQKYPKSGIVENEIENNSGTICTPFRTIKHRGVTYSCQKCDFLNYSRKEWSVPFIQEIWRSFFRNLRHLRAKHTILSHRGTICRTFSFLKSFFANSFSSWQNLKFCMDPYSFQGWIIKCHLKFWFFSKEITGERRRLAPPLTQDALGWGYYGFLSSFDFVFLDVMHHVSRL